MFDRSNRIVALTVWRRCHDPSAAKDTVTGLLRKHQMLTGSFCATQGQHLENIPPSPSVVFTRLAVEPASTPSPGPDIASTSDTVSAVKFPERGLDLIDRDRYRRSGNPTQSRLGFDGIEVRRPSRQYCTFVMGGQRMQVDNVEWPPEPDV